MRIAASTILASLFCACAAFGPAQGESPSSRQDASKEDHFNQGLVPIPQADKVEF